MSPFCVYGNRKYFFSILKGYGNRCLKKDCKCRVEWKFLTKRIDTLKKAQNKRRNTFIEKYGVENPSQYEQFQNSKIASNLKKFGCKWGTQHYSVKNKAKETNQKQYGVSYILQIPSVRDALKKYRNNNLDDILTKTKKTNLEKYGAEYLMQSSEFREKIQKLNLKKYGVAWTTQTELMKKKSQETCLLKYGHKNPMQSDIIKDRCIKNEITRSGVEWPSQRVLTTENYNILKNPKLLQEEINLFGVPLLAKEMNISHRTIYLAVKKLNLILSTSNSYENEISIWLDKHNINYVRNDRTQIKPKELDFYFPEHNVAIEFQGTYWHMDPTIFEAHDYNVLTHKTAKEHWDMDNTKIVQCAKKGVTLIQIWEEDWNNNKDDIKENILLTIAKTVG